MSPIDSIAALRALAARLRERDDPAADWFTQCLAQYETNARLRVPEAMESAFGLRPGGRGRESWVDTEARLRRDEMIRRIKDRFFPGHDIERAAEAIARAAEQYRTGRFRLHVKLMAPPPEIVGTLRGELFSLLKIGAPLSKRTAQRALCHETPHSVAGRGASNVDVNSTTTGEHDGNVPEADGPTTTRPHSHRSAAA
ncbi:MAG TPA: hypothetical protein VJ738_01885 [Steroidobacteraceae bacterium]|nr:hypothetical protein [Steroidobacteraceae bacterium]